MRSAHPRGTALESRRSGCARRALGGGGGGAGGGALDWRCWAGEEGEGHGGLVLGCAEMWWVVLHVYIRLTVLDVEGWVEVRDWEREMGVFLLAAMRENMDGDGWLLFF